MALDKIKTDIIADTNVTIAKLATNTGIKSDRHSIPSLNQSGVNAMSSPQPGDLVFNSSIGKLQQYTGDNAWRTIDSPPILNSISPTTSSDGGTTITLTGSNFSSTISAVNFIGTNGTKYAAASYSRVSSTSVTAVTPDLLVAHEPYDVEITNDTGLSAILENILDAGGAPSFTSYLAGLTGVGQANTGLIKSINDGQASMGTIAASDPDGGTITFAATGTAVWSGRNISVASNGVVSGDPTNETGNSTYTQQITATDASGSTTNQNLQIYVVKEPITSSPTNSGTFSTNTYTGYKTFQLKCTTASTTTTANFTTYGNTLCDIFMIGGGGNGGARHGGGGGAGGAIKATGVFLTAATHACQAGLGAAKNTATGDSGDARIMGTDTTITNIGGSVTWSAKGGGYGGNHEGTRNPANGGCGGGSGLRTSGNTDGGNSIQASSHTPSSTVNGVSATVSVHGFDGGDSAGANRGGAGGGGVGAVGTSADNTNTAGVGGTGMTIDFWDGTSGNTVGTHRFGGGGGGGGHGGTGVPTNPGFGGGTGSAQNGDGGDATATSGGGGGAGGGNGNTGGRGGNGTIMFRIPYG